MSIRYLFVASITTIIIGLVIAGCKSDETPTTPSTPVVTQIVANGTIAPVSRTQAQGILFVADQNGNPVQNLTAQNVSAVLRWETPGPTHATAMDSVLGTVILQSTSQSGKTVAVATTMDYSGSMFVGDIDTATGKYLRILGMEDGVRAFVNAMRTGDIGEIIKFGSDVYVVQPFTGNHTLLLHAVDTLSQSLGNTALYESIVTGIRDAGQQPTSTYARAVIAFTDGGENNSYPITRDTIFAEARAYGIPVYTIGLLDSSSHSEPPGQYSNAERDLVEIADTTGGFYFYAPTSVQLGQIYQTISGQISNSYQTTINWPGTTLPPSGTLVTAVITIVYGNVSAVVMRTYIIP